MGRNRKFVLVAALSMSCTVFMPASPGLAQEVLSAQSPRSPAEIIALFDENGDKKVDRMEWRLKSIRVFYKLDKNKDGFLRKEDLPSITAEEFAAADKDKDGKLSTFEYSQADFLQFKNLDANKDGYITADEIEAFQKRAKMQ